MPEDHTEINCPYRGEFGETKATLNFIKETVKEIKELQQKQNGRVGLLEVNMGKVMVVGGVLIILVPVIIRLVWG